MHYFAYPKSFKGPSIGDPFGPEDHHPRAVRREFFDEVCPRPDIISSDDVWKTLTNDSDALEITNAWVSELGRLSSPCIEVNGWSKMIFPFL